MGQEYNKLSGWPSGLRHCVQVAVSLGGVGSNPTPDTYVLIIFFQLFSPKKCPFRPETQNPPVLHDFWPQMVDLREFSPKLGSASCWEGQKKGCFTFILNPLVFSKLVLSKLLTCSNFALRGEALHFALWFFASQIAFKKYFLGERIFFPIVFYFFCLFLFFFVILSSLYFSDFGHCECFRALSQVQTLSPDHSTFIQESTWAAK